MGVLAGHNCWGTGKEHTAPICGLSVVSPLCLVPPELTGDLDPVTNVSAALHSPLTLLCEATGVPPPRVRWFRGEEPISPGEDTYLLAGKVPARGESGCQVWTSASASVYHLPLPTDPSLPGPVGKTI